MLFLLLKYVLVLDVLLPENTDFSELLLSFSQLFFKLLDLATFISLSTAVPCTTSVLLQTVNMALKTLYP